MIVGSVTIDKRKLTELIRRSPQQAEDLVDATAFEGDGYVKRSFGASPSAPGDPPGVDTGALRASIHVERLSRFERAIVTGVEYAAPLEFGTSRMASRPFMTPMAIYLRGQIPSLWARFAEV